MNIKKEECEAKTIEAANKLNETISWFEANWESIDEEGREIWSGYCANLQESLNYFL